MYKYVKFNKESGLCTEVGNGTNTDFYKSIGMVDMEVEQGYDGLYYLKGYAPTKPEEQVTLEDTQQAMANTQTRIAEIKDELITAVLLDDAETMTALKSEYKELMEDA